MKQTRKIAYMGLMLAVVMVLSFIEHMLPPLPLLPPNVKMGLSNIVTMYCLFFLGKREAVMLAVLKSGFVLLTRGPVAGLLSITGGLLSIAAIIMLIFLFGTRLSYVTASIFGAITHNLGQIIAVSFIMGTGMIFYYLPVLIVSGIIMGIVTGTMLKILLPVFDDTYKTITKE